MRKLITILGTIGLLTTTTTTVIACTDTQKAITDPVATDPESPAKTLLNEKITINDDDSITVVLFYYDGSEIAFLIDKDDVLNPPIKELKFKIDQINQSLATNTRELVVAKAGLLSFEQALLKNSQAISDAQVPFDQAQTQYNAVEKILSDTDENAVNYENIKNLFDIATNELNQAQKQLTYTKNIYKMNVENQTLWANKITWLEDNIATSKDEALTAQNDLLAILQTGKFN